MTILSMSPTPEAETLSWPPAPTGTLLMLELIRIVRLAKSSTISKQRLDLIPLGLSSGWSFDDQQSIPLPGAHDGEIVRCIYIDNAVSFPCIRDLGAAY